MEAAVDKGDAKLLKPVARFMPTWLPARISLTAADFLVAALRCTAQPLSSQVGVGPRIGSDFVSQLPMRKGRCIIRHAPQSGRTVSHTRHLDREAQELEGPEKLAGILRHLLAAYLWRGA